MNSRARLRILRTLPEVEEIRSAWESWPGHRDSDIDFFSNVVASNPGTIRPHIIVAYSDGKPDAILIGRIDLTTLPLRIGYWRVPTPQVRLLTFVIGAQRGNSSPEMSELLLREALNSLRRREADVARMEYVRANSVLHRLATSLPGIIGRDHGATSTPHWSMELPKTYEEVLQTLSGDLRGQLKRKAKKIQADFASLSVRCFEKPEELDLMMRDVETVAAKSYQRGLRVGFHDDQETRQGISYQMTNGRYLAYVLYLDGKPSAFWLGSLYGSVFYSDYLGFDPAFSGYSPGTFVQTKVLQDLLIRQATRVDFGPGDARYKAQWGTACQEEVTLYVFPSAFHGVALNLLRTLSALGNKAGKALIIGVGVLPRLKRILRDAKTVTPPHKSAATTRRA